MKGLSDKQATAVRISVEIFHSPSIFACFFVGSCYAFFKVGESIPPLKVWQHTLRKRALLPQVASLASRHGQSTVRAVLFFKSADAHLSFQIFQNLMEVSAPCSCAV
jgi:hypothetical protein